MRNEQGFTLLETIIAMTIMVLALASILSVESSGINAAEKTKQLNTVSMLARNKMIETEFKIQGRTFEEARKTEEGQFKSPYEDYRWKAEIKEIKFPNLVNTGSAGGANQSSGSGNSGNGRSDATEMLGKLVTNFLSKALREVTVTIFYKRSTGEQSFSVTTYWVNLNHEFALSE